MYTFKLQAVLDHRQFIEDQLNKDFAEINQRIMTIKKQMDQLRRKEMETIRALKNEQSLGISSDQVIVYHAYLRQLGDRLANQAKTLVNVENEACEKRDALLDAVKRRKILEKLKAQGIDRYNRAILEDEMKFIDEIAVNQFARKSLNTNGGRE